MDKQNRIMELRKQAGLSQEQLGEIVGCNKSKISKLENGKQELTQSWMIKISKALSKQGIIIVASDLLPPEQAYHDEKEREALETIRNMSEPERDEFENMVKLIKKKK